MLLHTCFLKTAFLCSETSGDAGTCFDQKASAAHLRNRLVSTCEANLNKFDEAVLVKVPGGKIDSWSGFHTIISSTVRTPSDALTTLVTLGLICITWMHCRPRDFSYKTKSLLNTISDMNSLNSAPPSPLPSVYSPWDQSGWRCERGRCRCSRSRQRGELHRPSRTSRARLTHGARMHAASAGVAAVAVPGRCFPNWEITNCGTNMADIIAHKAGRSQLPCLNRRIQLVLHGLDIFSFFFANLYLAALWQQRTKDHAGSASAGTISQF